MPEESKAGRSGGREVVGRGTRWAKEERVSELISMNNFRIFLVSQDGKQREREREVERMMEQ